VHAITERDDHSSLDLEARAVHLAAIHANVAVGDHLASGPDRSREARSADHVVEATLEELHEQLSGVALRPRRLSEVAAELLLEHAVVVAQLLLLVLADAVCLRALAAEAVHAGCRELALGGVLWDVRNGNTDAAGELDLGSDVASHK